MEYSCLAFGQPGTLLHRHVIVSSASNIEVSPLHGIPLYSQEENSVHMVVTTPRREWVCREVSTDEPLNPLRTTCRDGSPSHFRKNAPWNIGILPQTWGDTDLASDEFGSLAFVEHPLQVLDVGSDSAEVGDVYAVKPLAAFALVDSKAAKISWTIVAVRSSDNMVHEMEDMAELVDIQRIRPGLLLDVREWLRTALCTEPGDLPRVFGLNGRPQGRDIALRVIAQTHGSWQLFLDGLDSQDVSPMGLTRSPSEYEDSWHQYCAHLSTERIPLSNQNETSSVLLRSLSFSTWSPVDAGTKSPVVQAPVRELSESLSPGLERGVDAEPCSYTGAEKPPACLMSSQWNYCTGSDDDGSLKPSPALFSDSEPDFRHLRRVQSYMGAIERMDDSRKSVSSGRLTPVHETRQSRTSVRNTFPLKSLLHSNRSAGITFSLKDPTEISTNRSHYATRVKRCLSERESSIRQSSSEKAWQEALQQYSLTLGRPVDLGVADEDKGSMEWDSSSQGSSIMGSMAGRVAVTPTIQQRR